MSRILIAIFFSILIPIQRLWFLFFYVFFAPFRWFNKPIYDWVIGPEEIATMLFNIQQTIPNSASFTIVYHPFYQLNYNYKIVSKNKSVSLFQKLFLVPIVYAYLIGRSKGFIYLGERGFLFSIFDQRLFEFRFLNILNKKVISFFLGTDVRSTKLLLEMSKELNRDVISTYQIQINPYFNSTSYETQKLKLVEVAEKYSLFSITAKVDQKSYFKKSTKPFLYFYPNNMFKNNLGKFVNPSEIILLHAPSSPFIKGTPIVRAAIKKLQVQGYKFNYHELIRVEHSVVLNMLEKAHIVLNEFYSFVPGVFGIEAMANSCAVLTSADPKIEIDLGNEANEANDAWMITPYWEVYDNLKYLLDYPEKMIWFATNGFNWAKKQASQTASLEKFNQYLTEVDN